MNRVALVDGDTLVFAAASAVEKVIEWDADTFTLHSTPSEAQDHFERTLSGIRDGLRADRVIIALSDDKSRWRTSVMPTYKSNRKKTRKPICYKALRDYVHETQETFQRPTLEGDDVLGILATHPTLVKGEKIIVAIDKDMMTIPGLHLNYDKARGSDNYDTLLKVVSEPEANRFHMLQTLTGDTTDGYPGCPGIGPVKANKILDAAEAEDESADDFVPVWNYVVEAYKKAGLSEDVALMNARVARICRNTDYDFTKKEVKLWTP